jgi:Immunoglobulin domain
VARQASRVTLTCTVLAGSPVPQLAWRRADHAGTIAEGSSLIFESVERSDTGLFICEADNGYGIISTSSVELLILCKFLYIFILLYLSSFNINNLSILVPTVENLVLHEIY